jgi:hypothetical protein
VEQRIAALGKEVNDEERRDLVAIEASLVNADEEGLRRTEQSLRELQWRVRDRPYFDLRIDLQALSGLRVTSEQHAAFERGRELVASIDSRGGHKKATEEDLKRLRSLHDDLKRHHHDLDERRRTVLEDIMKSFPSEDGAPRADLKLEQIS